MRWVHAPCTSPCTHPVLAHMLGSPYLNNVINRPGMVVTSMFYGTWGLQYLLMWNDKPGPARENRSSLYRAWLVSSDLQKYPRDQIKETLSRLASRLRLQDCCCRIWPICSCTLYNYALLKLICWWFWISWLYMLIFASCMLLVT